MCRFQRALMVPIRAFAVLLLSVHAFGLQALGAQPAPKAPGGLHGWFRHAAFGVYAAQSIDMRTAAFNEPFDGSLSMLVVRATREVPHRPDARVQFFYVTELLPALVVESQAPTSRTPEAWIGDAAPDSSFYARRRSIGAGIAPLGADVMIRLTERINAVIGGTIGAEWFSDVVPYGHASRANFAISPRMTFEWRVSSSRVLGVSYEVHHISNGGLSDLNPGVNAHLLGVTLMRRPLH